jgi:hypothetical protein
MHNRLTQLGIAVTIFQTAILVIVFVRHRRRPLPLYGYGGLAGLICAEALLFIGVRPITTYFTPIAWTCYILLVDAAVVAITGHSRLRNHALRFGSVALLSIALWLIFEAYNVRLRNWTYVGVPQAWPLAWLGYGWSFATITPAIFETADLIESFGWFRPARGITFPPLIRKLFLFVGALCLLLPLIAPQAMARRLFLLVWIGFVFFLDPLNYQLGRASLLGDFERGCRSRFFALMCAGFVCGWYWEFWNYWAAAKWHYIFPMFQDLKIFEMPAPGYLGFLPFALECFVMYVTACWLLSLVSMLSSRARHYTDS